RRRRQQDGGTNVEHVAHALLACHRTARDAKRAEPVGPIERGPETDERSKREREKQAIGGGDAGRPVYVAGPDPNPPIPGVLGVEPPQRLIATGSRRLVQAHVAIHWEGEIGAKRWMGGLVREKL